MIRSAFGLGTGPVQLTGVMVPKPALHPQQHLPPEALAAQAPASPQHLEGLRIGLLQPPPLHPLLELRPATRRVLLDAVLAQQPVHPHLSLIHISEPTRPY